MKEKTEHSEFDIFYNWTFLNLEKYANATLSEIVKDDPIPSPVFYILDKTTENIGPIK